jgi:hypothetical protein
MNKEELQQILIEQGVPEDKITELVESLLRTDEYDAELKRQHEQGINEPIEVGRGIYLSHLIQNEPDWRKRAAIAASIVSSNLS